MKTLHEALEDIAGPLEAHGTLWSQTYSLEPDFPGFSGHFPGYPVLPGVVQVSMALRVIEQACNAVPVVREIVQTRFKAPVVPMQTVLVSVHPADPAADATSLPEKWLCTLTCGNVNVAQCRVLLEFPGETPTVR